MITKRNRIRNNILKQKKKYKALFIVMMVSISIGFILTFILSKSNKTIVKDYLIKFISSVSNNNVNQSTYFFNSLFKNLLYLVSIWILGLSIVGLPIAFVLYFFKSFILGFSISNMIYTFKIKGVLLSIVYLLPHQLIYQVILILVTYYSMLLSYRMFSMIVLKKTIVLKKFFKRYFKVLLISIFISILLSLYETYGSLYLIKLIYNLFK